MQVGTKRNGLYSSGPCSGRDGARYVFFYVHLHILPLPWRLVQISRVAYPVYVYIYLSTGAR